jgi:predicted RNA-binding protein with PUA-like domain
MNYWLLKSEPSTFSIEHLMQKKDQCDIWDGVRNYQARNFLSTMKVGDLAFFYHSSCTTPGIVGIIKISRAGICDPTQFDPSSAYYDVKATVAQPRWITVEVKLVKIIQPALSLAQLKTIPALQDWTLLKKGNRLSVMPVTPLQWKTIIAITEEVT